MSETDRETGQLEGDRLECEMQAGRRLQQPKRGDAACQASSRGYASLIGRRPAGLLAPPAGARFTCGGRCYRPSERHDFVETFMLDRLRLLGCS
jgi:hypothetical protein